MTLCHLHPCYPSQCRQCGFLRAWQTWYMNKSKMNINAVTKNWPYARFCISISMLIHYTFLLFGYLWRSAGWVYTSETYCQWPYSSGEQLYLSIITKNKQKFMLPVCLSNRGKVCGDYTKDSWELAWCCWVEWYLGTRPLVEITLCHFFLPKCSSKNAQTFSLVFVFLIHKINQSALHGAP